MKFQDEDDGANAQAQAVLAYLKYGPNIEESWNKALCEYSARPMVARWHNCREQGYVISMRGIKRDQINIAFFEHRNSDSICAIEWRQLTVSGNPPTIETMETGGQVYKDKWDVSHSVNVGQAAEMAEWIYDQLRAFWLASDAA